MKLKDLEATFLKLSNEEGTEFHMDVSFEEADGVMFLCPTCFENNNGPVGTHSIICWRPKVPQTINPVPGRWEFEGSSLEDLTLIAGSSSIQITGGCNAHFFVRNGEIIKA